MRHILKLLALILASLLATSACGGNGGNGGDAGGGDTDTTADSGDTDTTADSGDTQASACPTGDIEVIVPFAAGGGTDAVGRAVAQSLSDILDQNVVVVNREGGSGAVGHQSGLQATPDGTTLTLFTGEVVTLPIQGIASFDTFDFRYVGMLNLDPGVLTVRADSPYETFEALTADLEENPGELQYAASVVPDPRELIFRRATGLEYNVVPYDGAAPAIKDLLAGEADFGMYGPGEVKEQIEAGNLRPLAVMGEEPFTRFEGHESVPTMTSFGIEAIAVTLRGVAAPGDTPDDVHNCLVDAVGQVAEDPEFVDFMDKSFLGLEYKDPEETVAFLKERRDIIKPIIEEQMAN